MVPATDGKTVHHRIDYHSNFVGAFNNTAYKDLPRPVVLHQTFHFLPFIDKANKERQSTLSLEKKSLTKNCWMRAVTSLVGKFVVNMMRWDRHKSAGLNIILRNGIHTFDISEMADMITKPVVTRGLSAVDRRTQQRSKAKMRNNIRTLI